ncbi:Hypothetical protein mma_3027 [Janthinobacterium sp. Marseille]|uniref:Uncharacterized protein n=1 Tax=Herminiimonas aquatilis TaxID=345342 RepID=A0ABW2J7T0_9BURK|nr:hypothetical protein [Janthinobacterium sp. Marseille]ABR91874.1 Hypothetical protein mma_3027 [Janthinobacterium sp. Marseille]MBX9798568.1 hypothetical protein [Burkholderiaceae bacterium]
MAASKLTFSSQVFEGPLDSKNTPTCDILFVGKVVDDRGADALKTFFNIAKKVIKLGFQDQKLFVDDQETNVTKLATQLKGVTRVRFEATTLGMAEIVRALQAIKDAKIDEVEFFYVEPKDYKRSKPIIDGILSPREFELTDNNKFVSLQGFAQEFRDDQRAHHAFFLGYESSRLLQAFEQRGECNKDKYVRFFIIGVPAFSPGWETNVLANHAQIFKRMSLGGNSIKYCSASSIRESYHLLWDLYSVLGDESSVFWVSPLGTKPQTVAAALFLLETKGNTASTGLFYDHPIRTDKRSEKVARCHFVKIKGIQSI